MKNWSIRTLNSLTDLCVVLTLVCLVGGILYWGAQKPTFWLSGIDVEGAVEPVTPRMVADALNGHVAGTYFTVDIEQAREALMTISWVREASVRRVWPNRLSIKLQLHRPVAIWSNGQILSEEGVLFVANQAEADPDGQLPEFEGPAEQSKSIYEKYLQLGKVTQAHGAKIKSIFLSPLGSWRLTVVTSRAKDVNIILGPQNEDSDIVDKLKIILENLRQMASHLGAEPETIDARYKSGFAVPRPVVVSAEESAGTDLEMKDVR